jgi:branched-chain amino acid transport system substrate-binding protein
MSDRFARIIFTLGLLGVASPAAWAATLGPVTDDLGVVEAPKGAPIQIGGYWVLSGSDTADGEDQKRGVEVAIKDVGGQLDGHPIKLIAEDSLCSAQGGQTAATKLAANPNTVIVIGPSCSSHSVGGGHYLDRDLGDRPRADGRDAQAELRRVCPHDLQRHRSGQSRRQVFL